MCRLYGMRGLRINSSPETLPNCNILRGRVGPSFPIGLVRGRELGVFGGRKIDRLFPDRGLMFIIGLVAEFAWEVSDTSD